MSSSIDQRTSVQNNNVSRSSENRLNILSRLKRLFCCIPKQASDTGCINTNAPLSIRSTSENSIIGNNIGELTLEDLSEELFQFTKKEGIGSNSSSIIEFLGNDSILSLLQVNNRFNKHKGLEDIKKASQFFHEAISTATGIQTNEFEYKAKSLADIALALNRAGFTETSRSIYREAVTSCNQSRIQDEALKEVAIRQAKANFFSDAKETVQNIDNNTRFKSDALLCIAVEQTKIGEKSEARTSFNQTKDAVLQLDNEYVKSDTLRKITAEQTKAGFFEDAKVTARLINDRSRIEALSQIAIEQSKASDTVGAINTFNEAKDIASVFPSSSDYRDIASGLAKASLFDEALELTQLIDGNIYKAWALTDIANELFLSGNTEKAFSVFETAKNFTHRPDFRDEYKGQVLAASATALAKVGRFDDAIETATPINNQYDALTNIVIEQSKLALFDKAKDTAQLIDGEYWKAEALAHIAVEQFKAGLFDEAIETVLLIEPNSGKEDVATKLAKTGLYLQAESVAQLIDENEYKYRAFCAIAIEQFKADENGSRNNFQLAKEAALLDARDNIHRGMMLIDFATKQAEAGDYITARNSFDEAKNTEFINERDDFHKTMLANHLTVTGMLEEAEEVTLLINDTDSKERALSHIAIKKAEVGLSLIQP